MAKFPEYKREFKHTSELKENTAYMLLGHPVGGNEKSKSPYIIGAVFAEEMYFWRSVGKQVCVKINCPGGSIMDGFSIMDAIRTTNADVIVTGVAASMAVHILLSARKENRSAIAYARAMIHPPHGSDDKVMTEAFRGSLTQVLNDTTRFTKQEVEDMLKDGAPDTWMTAKEMKSKGLVSQIIPTNEEPEEVEENDPYKLYNLYNKLTENTMAKPEEKSLEESLQAFADLQNSLNEKTTAIAARDKEITDLKAKLQKIEDDKKAEGLVAATAKVEVAIKNKQIVIPAEKPELKNQFVQMVLTAPDAFEAMLAAKPAPRQSVINHIGAASGGTTEGEETYEYLANHNPKKLYEIMDNEPEKYQKMVSVWTEKQQNKKVA